MSSPVPAQGQAITTTIRNAVYTSFVTALEREDIENLANALYRIPKGGKIWRSPGSHAAA